MMQYLELPCLKTNIKLFLIGLLILITGILNAQTLLDKNSDTTLNNSNLYRYLNSRSKYTKSLILFSSTSSCTKCYENLEEFLCKKEEERDFNFILVIHYINDPKQRREYLKKSKVFAYCDTVFFEESNTSLIENNPQSGIFGYFNINYTPTILLIEKNQKTYLNYEYLFKNNFINKKAKRILKRY